MNEIVDASQSSTQELQEQIDVYKEKNRRELAELQRQLRERALELDRSQGAARGLQEEVGLTPATVSTTHPSHHCTRLAPHASRPRTRLTTTAIVPSHSSHPHFRATITPVIIVSPSQPSPPHDRLTRLPLTPVPPVQPVAPSLRPGLKGGRRCRISESLQRSGRGRAVRPLLSGF